MFAINLDEKENLLSFSETVGGLDVVSSISAVLHKNTSGKNQLVKLYLTYMPNYTIEISLSNNNGGKWVNIFRTPNHTYTDGIFQLEVLLPQGFWLRASKGNYCSVVGFVKQLNY